MDTDLSLPQQVASFLEGKSPITLDSLAEKCSCTALEVARALPAGMCTFAPGKSFSTVWKNIAQWEKATLILQSRGNVFEIQSKINDGVETNGYFNIKRGFPLSGHLRPDLIQEMGFLSLPFMGRESHSVQFFDSEGGVVFAIYVGRENHELLPNAKESFLHMQQQFA